MGAVTHTFSQAGVLTITGDGANDIINVQQSSQNVFYQANGSGNLGITPVGTVTAVVVNAGGGNDTVTAPSVTKPLTINGGAGDDTLSGGPQANTIIGGAGGDSIDGKGGADTLDGDDPLATTAFTGGEAQTSINTKFTVTATGGGVAYRQSSQGGVSTRGFGVSNPNDNGVSASRGIEGDGANSHPVETLIVKFADPDKVAVSATLTLGLNGVGAAGDPGYKIVAYYGDTEVGTVEGSLPGATGLLTAVDLSFNGALFDKVTIENTHSTADAFVLSAASFATTTTGDDEFRISNARDAFGDAIHGGYGTDTVVNATTAETIVLTDFRATPALGVQTVFDVETLYGNNKEIRGRDAGFDGAGNDQDKLDFTGMTLFDVTYITGRSGDDQIIGSDSNDVINGGAGSDQLAGGLGNDTINGEAGEDVLNGGEGEDVLNGGAGADVLAGGLDTDFDRFVCLVADANNNADTLTEFNQGSDQIEVNTSVYGQGQLDVVTGTGPSPTGLASEIRFASSGTTIYLPGTGANAFRQILVPGTFELTTADFLQN
ncbi:hypothetical protein [uncultured Lamprocystis sp.]|jgi:Ca2+-binding RTX toxin-like protein|uniref:calcium-binding protein n=1 Tax=uncultured Lamprocystis sp. TaxID=543132 RepID=UPI0025E2070D|nr:hypothetical protein [uncultured Lamprocystis sp.]